MDVIHKSILINVNARLHNDQSDLNSVSVVSIVFRQSCPFNSFSTIMFL